MWAHRRQILNLLFIFLFTVTVVDVHIKHGQRLKQRGQCCAVTFTEKMNRRLSSNGFPLLLQITQVYPQRTEANRKKSCWALSLTNLNYFYNDMDKPVKWRGASDSTWSKVKPASRDNRKLWPQDARFKGCCKQQREMLFEMKRGRSVSLHCASSAFLACPAGTALAFL